MADSPIQSPRQVFDRVIQRMLAIDMAGFGDLFSEDAVLEMPYMPATAPHRLTGREAIKGFLVMGEQKTPIKLKEIRDIEIHETTDPELIIAEFDGLGVVDTTGGTYHTKYVEVVRVRKGEIVFYRHYAELGSTLIAASAASVASA
jgi:uncharacterized protein